MLSMPAMSALLQRANAADDSSRVAAAVEISRARDADLCGFVLLLSKAARAPAHSVPVRQYAYVLLKQAVAGVCGGDGAAGAAVRMETSQTPSASTGSTGDGGGSAWLALPSVVRASVWLDIFAALVAPDSGAAVLRVAAAAAAEVAAADSPQWGSYSALIVAAASDEWTPAPARAAWLSVLQVFCERALVPPGVWAAAVDVSLAVCALPLLAPAALRALTALLAQARVRPRALCCVAAHVDLVTDAALGALCASGDNAAAAADAADCLCAAAGVGGSDGAPRLARIFSCTLEAARKHPLLEACVLDIWSELIANPSNAIDIATFAPDIFDAVHPALGRADATGDDAPHAAYLCFQRLADVALAAVAPKAQALLAAMAASGAGADGAQLVGPLHVLAVLAGAAGGLAAAGMATADERHGALVFAVACMSSAHPPARAAAAWAAEQLVECGGVDAAQLLVVADAVGRALCAEPTQDSAQQPARLLLALLERAASPPLLGGELWLEVFSHVGAFTSGADSGTFWRLLRSMIENALPASFPGTRALGLLEAVKPPGADAAASKLYARAVRACARKIAAAAGT